MGRGTYTVSKGKVALAKMLVLSAEVNHQGYLKGKVTPTNLCLLLMERVVKEQEEKSKSSKEAKIIEQTEDNLG